MDDITDKYSTCMNPDNITETVSKNDTDTGYDDDFSVNKHIHKPTQTFNVILAIYIPPIVLGTLASLTVLAAIAVKLGKTKMSIFLLSVTVTDLLTAVFQGPIYILEEKPKTLHASLSALRNVYYTDKTVCKLFHYLEMLTICLLASNLLFLSLERIIGTIYPKVAKEYLGKMNIIIITGVIWVSSLSFATIELCYIKFTCHGLVDNKDYTYSTACKNYPEYEHIPPLIRLVLLSVALGGMAISYTIISAYLYIQSRCEKLQYEEHLEMELSDEDNLDLIIRHRTAEETVRRESTYQSPTIIRTTSGQDTVPAEIADLSAQPRQILARKLRRVRIMNVVMLACVVTAFAICWLPRAIIEFQIGMHMSNDYAAGINSDPFTSIVHEKKPNITASFPQLNFEIDMNRVKYAERLREIHIWTVALALFHSSLNPLILFIFSPDIRGAVRGLFPCFPADKVAQEFHEMTAPTNAAFALDDD